MPSLKELLGDAFKEGMTFDEADAALKDKKIVDLASGEYVGKGKYDSAIKERDDARKERDDTITKFKDYDDLKKYRETNEAEKKSAEMTKTLEGYGVKSDMVDFVKFQISSGKIESGKDGKDLEKNVKEFIKANPQYGSVKEPEKKPQPNNKVHIDTGGDQGDKGQSGDGQQPRKVISHSWNRHL